MQKLQHSLLSPVEITESVERAIAQKRAVLIHGMPGVGKSSIARQIADRQNRQLIDMRGATLNPTDVQGMPWVVDGKFTFLPGYFLPSTGNALIIIDEINRAPMSVMNALMQFALDRRVGENVLSPDVDVIAAANYTTDGGGVSKMPAALSMRFRHLHLRVDPTDWRVWAINNRINVATIGYIGWRGADALHDFDPTALTSPNPRSWAWVSQITDDPPTRPEIMLAEIEGEVGRERAIDYMAYLKTMKDRPNIDAIIQNPTGAPIPDSSELKFATAAALSGRATDNNFGRIIQYLDRLPAEYASFAIMAAVKRVPSLVMVPEYTQWFLAHPEIQ